jgi:hypothetical protein
VNNDVIYLTKTRFSSALQCDKRLYLEVHQPELKGDTSVALQHLFATGNRVGELARELFPGGLHVDNPSWEQAEAEGLTREAMEDPSIPAVFEGAFSAGNLQIRADVLSRTADGQFDLFEVKMSASQKPEHIPDVAIQLWAIEQTGVSIRQAHLMHLNRDYVYPGGDIDIPNLLIAVDVTSEAREYIATYFPRSIDETVNMLGGAAVPTPSIGRHCKNPQPCPFVAHCRKGLPDHYVEQLPGLTAKTRGALSGINISDSSAVAAIPASFKLNVLQERMRQSVLSGEPYVGVGLAAGLEALVYPIHSLDFETFMPAVPLYPGTHPYTVIQFQWSLHSVDANGDESHCGFLWKDQTDPRGAFLESLLASLPPTGSVAVYSSYEETQLKALAVEFPQHAPAIAAVILRLVDLLKIVRGNFYSLDFHGSFSIKAVLPALVPEMTYKDLNVGDGLAAAASYATMIDPETPAADQEIIYANLWEYCKQDTLALVRVIQALRAY